MAKRDNEEFTKGWLKRLEKGQKSKTEGWEKEYEIAACKSYWRGKQLENPLDEFHQQKVQINKIHPTVKASIPTLYFHNPHARVYANPALADTPGASPVVSIDDRVQLLQDTANTLIMDPKVGLDETTHNCLKEAHWAFGCVRVMHDGTPVENPAVKPSLSLKETKDTPEPPAAGPRRIGEVLGLSDAFESSARIRSERFYIKRIPSRQVIFPADHTGVVMENAWVGYWAICYLEDVRRIYKTGDELKSSGVKTNEDDETPVEGSGGPNSEKIKLYYIWDLRSMMHLVFADGYVKKPLLEKKFKRLPLKFLRFDVDPDSAYPIPPIYHELYPQDEFNDSREWLRKNRKGTVPRYTYDKVAIDPEHMKKLETGEMGTYIPREPNTHNVIEPVQQPNYSAVAMQTLALSKEEFTELSMVAGERRGVPQSRTATQAKIIDVRSQTTESFDRVTVAKWIASIVEELILLAIDEMSLNRWIMMNADPSAAGFTMESQRISEMWRQISVADLKEASDGVEWHVVIEEGSMSPVSLTQEREDWMKTMAFFENPIAVRLLALSPQLRKRTLYLSGIKSARDQELIGEAFGAMIGAMDSLTMGGAPPPPGRPSPPSESGGPQGPPGTAGRGPGVPAENPPGSQPVPGAPGPPKPPVHAPGIMRVPA